MKSSKILTKLALKLRHKNLFLPGYAKTSFWQQSSFNYKLNFGARLRRGEAVHQNYVVHQLVTKTCNKNKVLVQLMDTLQVLQKQSFCMASPYKNFVFVTPVKYATQRNVIQSKATCNWYGNKPDSYIPKYCFKLNNGSNYRVLTLRSSNILYRQRKKHKIIRPLLDFKRESITMVCKDLKIPVYPDKSNRSVQYSRNRIRKQIIPGIKYFINPQVENSLFKVAQLLQKEQSFVYSLLKNTSINTQL